MTVLERIKSKVSRGASVVGLRDVSEFLRMYEKLALENAELKGEIEMWKANADEAALKMARLQARVAELEDRASRLEILYAQSQRVAVESENVGREFICKILLDDMLVCEAGGNWPNRMQIELNNLRAQVAEARALGYPVNLFEECADRIKLSQNYPNLAGVVTDVAK